MDFFFHMGMCPLASSGIGSLPRPFPNTTFISLTIWSTSSPVRLRGLVWWFALPLKYLPFFHTRWFTGRNWRWPRYATFRHFFKNTQSRSHNSVCMHYIPCLTSLKDYLEQANHWLLQTAMLAGQSALVCTRPTHEPLVCSIKVEVHQLMALDRHRCRC